MTSTTVELTERQEEILRYIAREIDSKGYQPSFRELMKRFKIRSPNGVKGHLLSMERKGFVTINERASRALSFNWKAYL
jgi:repressor LexA